MSLKLITASFTVMFLLAQSAWADGASSCMKCHDSEDFSDLTAAEIAGSIRDTSIPPHRKLADLSDEQVQAIAAELAGR